MADLRPIGVNLETGQINYAQGGDTLKPSSGNLTVSSGDSSATAGSLTLQTIFSTGADENGGNININTAEGNGDADGGWLTVSLGDSGLGSFGGGGSIYVECGDAASSQGGGGGFELICGNAAGAGTSGGSVRFSPGSGYDYGSISLEVSGISTTADGGIVRVTGGSDGSTANYAVQIKSVSDTAPGASTSSILIQSGDASDEAGTIEIDTGLNSLGGIINIGMQNASEVNIRGLNAASATFGSTTTGGLTAGDALAEAGLIKVSPGFTSIGDGVLAAGLSFGPVYYDTNNGQYVRFGNSIFIDGDGLVVRSGDGDDTQNVFPFEVDTDNASYNLASAGAIDTVALEPGTVTIQVILDDGSNFSTVTDNGAGVFPSGAVLPSGGTVNYAARTLTGITDGLEIGSRVNISYQTANTAGEVLTVRAGDGNGTAAGGNLTLRSGNAGSVGDSGDVLIDTGAITSGTAGSILLGSTNAVEVVVGRSSGSLGFYGVAAVAQQTVTGSRGGNVALADLLAKLADLGLIVDGTSA